MATKKYNIHLITLALLLLSGIVTSIGSYSNEEEFVSYPSDNMTNRRYYKHRNSYRYSRSFWKKTIIGVISLLILGGIFYYFYKKGELKSLFKEIFVVVISSILANNILRLFR